jgi:hypothetical protein
MGFGQRSQIGATRAERACEGRDGNLERGEPIVENPAFFFVVNRAQGAAQPWDARSGAGTAQNGLLQPASERAGLAPVTTSANQWVLEQC